MTRKAVSVSVAGDSGSEYTVTFVGYADSRASLQCTCPAGKKGTLCKHVRDLLEGNTKRVVERDAYLEEFMDLLVKSPLLGIMSPLLQRLTAAEKKQEALKNEISILKKNICGLLSSADITSVHAIRNPEKILKP